MSKSKFKGPMKFNVVALYIRYIFVIEFNLTLMILNLT